MTPDDAQAPPRSALPWPKGVSDIRPASLTLLRALIQRIDNQPDRHEWTTRIVGVGEPSASTNGTDSGLMGELTLSQGGWVVSVVGVIPFQVRGRVRVKMVDPDADYQVTLMMWGGHLLWDFCSGIARSLSGYAGAQLDIPVLTPYAPEPNGHDAGQDV